jgi:hypothetical protein
MEAADATQYAFVYGARRTRGTLAAWNEDPWPVVRQWLLGSAAAAIFLLAAVWAIAAISPQEGQTYVARPPLGVGDPIDALRIFGRNLLVLALHAMACVAGFIAGSSLPMQAPHRTGISKVLHEKGGTFAIAFVVAATTFSLSAQSYVLGQTVAHVAAAIHASPGVLLLGLLPHAIFELIALFLPLAAWIIASRKGEWDKLLAATVVTVAIALPMLIVTACWEVYVAPHVMHALIHYPAAGLAVTVV